MQDFGFLFWALDPELMLPGGEFPKQMTELVAKIKATPPGGMPSRAVEYGANVVIQPPYAAENARFQSESSTSAGFDHDGSKNHSGPPMPTCESRPLTGPRSGLSRYVNASAPATGGTIVGR